MKANAVWSAMTAVLGLVCITVLPPVAKAGQFETLTPLLINLNGWQAEAPEGMDMDMGSTKMVQAMRAYTKGGKSLNAMVMVGNSMMMTQGQMQPANIETDEVEVKTETINGFRVAQQYDKKEVEGAVVVSMGGSDQKGAQFILHYTGLRPGEALSMAKKFDWVKLQKAAAKIK